ncbi:hypothetical protein ACFSTE_09430 [Aquimarina hainanensis]|uniref:Uncharacterized protein n=1 Tax=Aquimarina hainanensis TaxID=1578017 RepID=A0ABW5N5Z4_9FLAO
MFHQEYFPDGMRVEWAEGLDAKEKELLGYAIYTLRKNSKTFNNEFIELHSSKMTFTVGKASGSWGLFDRPLPKMVGGDEDEEGNISEVNMVYDMSEGAKGGKISLDLDTFKQMKREGVNINALDEALNVLPEEFSGAALFLYYGTIANGKIDEMPASANIEYETKMLAGVVLNESGIGLSKSKSQRSAEEFGIQFNVNKKTLEDYFNALESWHTAPDLAKHYKGLSRNKKKPLYSINNQK